MLTSEPSPATGHYSALQLKAQGGSREVIRPHLHLSKSEGALYSFVFIYKNTGLPLKGKEARPDCPQTGSHLFSMLLLEYKAAYYMLPKLQQYITVPTTLTLFYNGNSSLGPA